MYIIRVFADIINNPPNTKISRKSSKMLLWLILVFGGLLIISAKTRIIYIYKKFYGSRLRVAGNKKILTYDKQKNEV